MDLEVFVLDLRIKGGAFGLKVETEALHDYFSGSPGKTEGIPGINPCLVTNAWVVSPPACLTLWICANMPLCQEIETSPTSLQNLLV